jgi:hypothetical protein
MSVRSQNACLPVSWLAVLLLHDLTLLQHDFHTNPFGNTLRHHRQEVPMIWDHASGRVLVDLYQSDS